jgi:hypothetical protein
MTAQNAAPNCAEPSQTVRAVQFGAYSQKLNCAQSKVRQTERETAQHFVPKAPHSSPQRVGNMCGSPKEKRRGMGMFATTNPRARALCPIGNSGGGDGVA